MSSPAEYLLPFDALSMADVPRVGGKNASLGEMIGQLSAAGVRVPGGFATTAQAYWDFLDHNDLRVRIEQRLDRLDIDDLTALADAGREIRAWVEGAVMPPVLEDGLRAAYRALGERVSVAVRSSATAEDLPEASFAGQQESYLHVRGEDEVVWHVKRVFASLYNDRAIAYRVHTGYAHAQVALSAGIQRMVRSDLACAGVMFTLDTESGFRDAVFITAAYGLGETVVQGAVNPDEFYVHKPMLAAGFPAVVRRELGDKAIRMVWHDGANVIEATPPAQARRYALADDEVLELARQAMVIESHYGRPMDIEWAKDGETGGLFIVQARPETVKARGTGADERYALKESGRVLVSGRAIGQKIGCGRVRVIASPAEMHRVEQGDVLVTDMTDPDWEPVMKRAAAIVTDRGGRTCHAAIVARELGVPTVVGTGDASSVLADGSTVTVSCAEGETGFVYDGALRFGVETVASTPLPEPPVKLMMNVGNPERAFQFAQIPNHGVGLARLEFVIARMIGVHPLALLATPPGEIDALAADSAAAAGGPDGLSPELIRQIRIRSAAYASPVDFYIDKLAEGVATLAAAFWPKPVIVRLSDFKSNEYANLLGGAHYEPREENPMLGLRGAARYVSPMFRPAFELECRAIRKVRETLGYTNVEVMIPFVRTVAECVTVVDLLAANGLARGGNGLRLIMMCEVPSNAVLADAFLAHVDGFSIGSNDLTQLTLGIDRDSGLVAADFDERNPAVQCLLKEAISACNRLHKYIGICGQGPSDHPDFAAWLVEQGIGSISLNPDTVVATWRQLTVAGDI
ncbi:MAG: phosphoenolpyruvate synthase [Hydrogenophilales bacterium 16-64-46]|nr:MAG: phosphoenolpyruvate synthase [Hydrogenophilales bacterium 12-64-13]OYZ04861.1 MAG: phosphoenolpyruvate synthase [Hydrogenophilales bacterium 16-64-46]OZA37504.1 MAG: phosphoenolpyruvate synthase [Hydrogenophilales bacterium 17-64-34]HQT00686.1 phosphoenolpyruvate synthase [Thiobacillus sp.]